MKIATLIQRLQGIHQQHGDVKADIQLDIDEAWLRVRIEPDIIDVEVRNDGIRSCLVLHIDWE